MKYKTIRKHYKEGNFHFDKKSKHWISKDGKLKLQDGDMYFLFDADGDPEKMICKYCCFENNCELDKQKYSPFTNVICPKWKNNINDK